MSNAAFKPVAKIVSIQGSLVEINFPLMGIMLVPKAMLKQYGVSGKLLKVGAEFAC